MIGTHNRMMGDSSVGHDLQPPIIDHSSVIPFPDSNMDALWLDQVNLGP